MEVVEVEETSEEKAAESEELAYCKAQLGDSYNDYAISHESSHSAVIPGISILENGVSDSETISKVFAITVQKDTDYDWYFNDGRYNNMDFLVSEHVLFENEKEYPLYKINAPTKPATDFLFSKNVPAYKFESSEPKNIYKYDGKITFELVAKMDKIVAGEWNEIPLEISTLEKEIMIVIVPANVELSTYIWKENKDSRSAYIFKSN